MALQHLRSNTANKRPTAGAMSDGQIAVNTNATSPGLFFKDAGGTITKVGPVHVGTTAPNSSPAAGGSTGNSVGEQWLDTSGGGYVLKIWDGSAWSTGAGEFVDAAGDTMTGALILPSGTAAAPALGVGSTDNGLYSPGTDQVALSTNGTGQLFVDANGNVGVGNSSPSAKLEVANSASGINDNSTDGQVETIGYIELGTSNAVGNRGPSAAIGHIIKTDLWSIQNFSSQIGFFTAQNTGGALTQKAVITNEGRLGVATTSPGGALEVNAAAATAPAIFKINASEAARIDSSGRLLVNTSTARDIQNHNAKVQLEGIGYNNSTLQIFGNQNNTEGAYLFLGKSRGTTLASNTIVQAGDELGTIGFYGTDGTTAFRAARIGAYVDGTPGANDMPGRLVFSTTADGASSPTERMRITSTGQMRLAGAGITFNGDTAAANELDDYEEGTWTPTVGDVNAGTTNTPSTTSFTSSGVYTKVGNTVTVEGIFNIGDSGTNVTVTDRFSMSGLPYPMPNGDFGGVGTFGGRGATSPLGLNNMTFGTTQAAGGSSVMYFSFEKLLSGATQTYDQQLSFSFSYTI